MIRWCAENNMFQQAATIYTDKMPKYYFEKGLVPSFVDLSTVTVSPGHNLYDTGFYYLNSRCYLRATFHCIPHVFNSTGILREYAGIIQNALVYQPDIDRRARNAQFGSRYYMCEGNGFC